LPCCTCPLFPPLSFLLPNPLFDVFKCGFGVVLSLLYFSFCQQIVWFCVSVPIWFCVELIFCCLVLFFSEFIYFQITRFDTNCSDTAFVCAFRIHPSLHSLL
jgi:hypothetical protein